ncbi:hypothetical protein HIM_09073 [Hirsutella minnesotensis 3608]|uniref:Heme haloperoxidase family profile domain-containing protein n=1 Tax=Hirsutella minnesotensis 3608 TaxID=1043627 RepID=A0A0F7ZLX1_9HYPO|nr:hypothetical protein HIM_09073 [Hirsutella minnesotensis 3608]
MKPGLVAALFVLGTEAQNPFSWFADQAYCAFHKFPVFGPLLLKQGSAEFSKDKKCWWYHPLKLPPPPKKPPTFNVLDPRFDTYHPRGQNDSRCSCPALNTLANHGFLPHNGKNITIVDVVIATFEAFGVSPETSALIAADGFVEAKRKLDTSFDLEEFQTKEFGIEHDVSFSRKDSSEGDVSRLDPDAWNVTRTVMHGCKKIDGACFGRARLARIEHEKQRNPRTRYNKDAAAYGATEVGMLLGVYGTDVRGGLAEYCIRQLFEHEWIPKNHGCRPSKVTSKYDVTMKIALESLQVSPKLQNVSPFIKVNSLRNTRF